MKRIVILGGGLAGTMMANHLSKILPLYDLSITLVEESPIHFYGPGFLMVPFGFHALHDIERPSHLFYPKGVRVIWQVAKQILPKKNQILLSDGAILPYDLLIVSTGCSIHPEETEGLLDLGPLHQGWHKNIFDFYTPMGCKGTAKALKEFKEGKLVVHTVELPIKCPVAPLEFAFLADWYFSMKGIRSRIEIEFVTPLAEAFTKPLAAKHLGHLLKEKNIKLTTDFNVESVDISQNKMRSFGGKEVSYDLLIITPTNMGSKVIADSELGDDLHFIPTNKETLVSNEYSNIFVLGDATNVPTSKAGSVAHFEAHVVTQNVIDFLEERPLSHKFDGHANCFVETGFGKALLIDFSYDVDPLLGKFPLPFIGPLSLLKESSMNHYAKLLFKDIYWNLLLQGRPLPLPSKFSLKGKRRF